MRRFSSFLPQGAGGAVTGRDRSRRRAAPLAADSHHQRGGRGGRLRKVNNGKHLRKRPQLCAGRRTPQSDNFERRAVQDGRLREVCMHRALSRGIFVSFAVVWVVMLLHASVSSQSFGARDPGVRGGEAGAGGPLGGLSANELAFFQLGLDDFDEAEEVDEGLGPRMNLDGCGGCHAQPAIGGSSPATNPQVAFASKDGGIDTVPSFITLHGPIREARFVRNPDGTPDGGVAALFTIAGREGAKHCRLQQPDFATEVAKNNVIFRIPTPVFGAGLIEQIEDTTIVANMAANSNTKQQLGIRGRANVSVSGRTISGVPNRNGNDGTITRFGWKAQNVSLLIFAGEAYNVEMGISNELFQNEREQDPDCYFASVPNDVQNMEALTALTGMTAIQNFANFQRLLAPPTPSSDTPGGARSIARGRAAFERYGMCPVSFADAPHQRHSRPRRSPQPSGEPLLRPAGSRHGRRAGRRRVAGTGRTAGLPDRAALGARPARLLPARRTDGGPRRGHPSARERWLGSEQCDQQLQHAQREHEAGHLQLPAIPLSGRFVVPPCARERIS